MTKIEFGNSMCLQEEGICFWTLGYALKVCLSLSFVCGSCKPLKKKTMHQDNLPISCECSVWCGTGYKKEG